MNTPNRSDGNAAHDTGRSAKNDQDKIHVELNLPTLVAANQAQRPTFHFVAPWGWMNDPCAPGYDPNTKTYHLFYQWNPLSTLWDGNNGHMTWGHATSTDLLHWQHSPYPSGNPAILNDAPYDHLGVFTGCFYPTDLHGEPSGLTALYTSITYLPFHWSMPYKRGAEGLALASSNDGGKTWHKSAANPILACEPDAVDVTGWRDPFLAKCPALDQLRGCAASLYGFVSGGIKGVGPTVFLYAVDPGNLEKWEYLNHLVDFPTNFSPDGGKWSGDFGMSWECTNFFTLSTTSDHSSSPPPPPSTRHFLALGAETATPRPHIHAYALKYPTAPVRVNRQCLWLSGPITAEEAVSETIDPSTATDDSSPPSTKMTPNPPKMHHALSGHLDCGPVYAAATMYDPLSHRTIVYGWLPGDDAPNDFHAKRGWSGYLGIPREAFLMRMEGVVGTAAGTEAENMANVSVLDGVSGKGNGKVIETLGVRPLRELETLRKPPPLAERKGIPLPASTSASTHIAIPTQNWELAATFTLAPSCTSLTLLVTTRVSRDNPTDIRSVSITYSIPDEEITLDRSNSNSLPEYYNNCPEKGPFTLFTKSKPGEATPAAAAAEKEKDETEPLILRIFWDHNILEVFANDRFAISTVVYGDEGWEFEDMAVTFSAEGEGGEGSVAVVEEVVVWEMEGGVVA